MTSTDSLSTGSLSTGSLSTGPLSTDDKLQRYHDMQACCGELLLLLAGDDPDPAQFAVLQDRLAHTAQAIETIHADNPSEASQLARAAQESDRLVRAVASAADGRAHELAAKQAEAELHQRAITAYAGKNPAPPPHYLDRSL